MIRKIRSGFQFVELIGAFALMAGVVLVIMQLNQANLRNAHRLQARCAARLFLIDVSELLAGESLDRLKELSIGDSSAEITKTMENRVTRLPESCREFYRKEISPMAGHMKCVLEEGINGLPSLVRLKVSLNLPDGQQVEITRLYRPSSRYLPNWPAGQHNSDDSSGPPVSRD